MTHAQIRLLCLLMLLLLCLPLFAACNTGDQSAGTAQQTTEQITEQATTQPATTEQATTEPDVSAQATTQLTTEAPTTDEVTTEEVTTEEQTTQPPEPELLTSLSFSALDNGIVLSEYFFNAHQCSASLTADEDGTQVLSLSASNTPVGAASSSDPYIYFRHTIMAKDLGYKAIDTREYPHLVLRVKNAGRTGNVFSLFGYSNKSPSGTGVVGQLDAHVRNNDEWQYVYFDLSASKKNLIVLRLDFTNIALADGEALYISDMQFFATADEAKALLTPDTYPILEQSVDDYVAKIMSFNVQTENGTSVRPDIRMDMLRNLIDEYKPDSIGLQEVTTKWRDMMDSYCFNQSYASVGAARTPGGEANPIYYRVDKFELLDSGTFWLSDTPEVEGSYFETSLYPRICTWAHLRDKVTGKEYVHLNTHLDHLSGSDGRSLRTKQITVILRFMQRFGDTPMVLTGDLNQAAVNQENSQYAVYKTLTGAKAFKLEDGTQAYSPLSNARYDAPDNMPEGECATMTQYYDKNGTKYNPAKEPIDYVLYTRASLTALSYKIRLYDLGSIYLSDHLPVICDIKFTPAE